MYRGGVRESVIQNRKGKVEGRHVSVRVWFRCVWIGGYVVDKIAR